MPFAKLIQPTPAKKYDPKREAMFAQLLARGQAPAQDIGTVIGNLAQQFVGQRGLAKQGKAQQMELDQSEMEKEQEKAQKMEALARVYAGLGIEADTSAVDALSNNPGLQAEFLQRSRPQEPETPKPRPNRQGTGWLAVLRRHPGASASRC